MFKLDYIDLPYEFIKLLKLVISNNEQKHERLIQYVKGSKDFNKVLRSIFSNNLNLSSSLVSILRSSEWDDIKLKIFHFYLNKASLKYTNNPFHFEDVLELINLEEQIDYSFPKGFGHCSTLLFYIVIDCFEKQIDLLDHPLYIDNSIKRYLSHIDGKNKNIDLLIIILKHLDIFIGSAELTHMVAEKESFDTIYGQLKVTEQKTLLANLIAYSASTFQNNLFTEIKF